MVVENVWTLFVVVSCLAMPPVIALMTVAHPFQVLAAAPARAELIALVTGFTWGFGAILFGQGVSAIGISMANTLVLATSAALGSILPIFVLASERLGQPQGKAIMLGTVAATRESCGSGPRKRAGPDLGRWSVPHARCGLAC